MFEHISKLLEAHNCVIIPGFGGFVAEYRPAQLHPVTNEFSPPSKSIAFNPLLTNNDGLLSQFIAGTEDIPFEAAAEKVRQFGRQCDESLKQQKNLKCPGLGKLALDLENKLQFHPDISDNLLSDAYGLNAFTATPISRSKKQAIIKQQQAMAEVAPMEKPEPTRKFGSMQLAWAVAATILVAILVAQLLVDKPLQNLQYSDWQFWNSDKTAEPAEAHRFEPPEIITSLQEQMRSFGKTRAEAPAEQEEATDSEAIVAEVPTKVSETPKAEKTPATRETVKETVTKTVKESGLTDALTEAPIKEPTQKEIKEQPVKTTREITSNAAVARNETLPEFLETPTRGYYCIVGSYLNEAQARQRLNRLPEGNNGRVILKGRNGYFRAGIFIHSDEMTAELQLRKLRSEFGQADAWIVKY